MERVNGWFFVGHSIGVTLLGIHTLETLRRSLPVGTEARFYIVVNGDKTHPYTALLTAYPHITLVHLGKRSLRQTTLLIAKSIFSSNYIFHPLNFGQMHHVHRVVSNLLLWGNPSSRFVEFVDGETKMTGRHILLKKNFDQSIFVSLEDAVESVGLKTVRAVPALGLHREESLHQMTSPYIVVQPFAASPVRSLPMSRWELLVRWIRVTYPQYSIVISGGPGDREASVPLLVDEKVVFIGDVVRGGLAGELQVLADAALYVGPDTGPTHLAAHLGTKTILVGNQSNPCWLPNYAPTVIILTAPEHCTCTGAKGGNCFVQFEGKEYYRCMLEVTNEEIQDAITRSTHE